MGRSAILRPLPLLVAPSWRRCMARYPLFKNCFVSVDENRSSSEPLYPLLSPDLRTASACIAWIMYHAAVHAWASTKCSEFGQSALGGNLNKSGIRKKILFASGEILIFDYMRITIYAGFFFKYNFHRAIVSLFHRHFVKRHDKRYKERRKTVHIYVLEETDRQEREGRRSKKDTRGSKK